MNWEIKNAIVVSEEGIIPQGGLSIKRDKIDSVLKKAETGKSGIQVDLDGLLVFPGLINGHDHLLGTYVPKVGDNRPYINWLPWDNDLKASPIYAERQQLDARQLYLMGAYRHMINGVTCVQDHIPHFVQTPYLDMLPIRIISDFTIAHSINSFSLAWGEGIEVEYQKAVEKNLPFVTHCSEGFDAETKNAVNVLFQKNALGPNTVLIHGIAFSDKDIELLAKKNVNVVWCPNSNLYMFNETTNIKGLLEAGVNVCLGTDSPMSGSVNMFDEIKTAMQYYQMAYDEDLNPRTIYDMITVNPAKAFKLSEKQGSLAAGKLADFIVVDGNNSDPYRSLTQAELKDIKLVVIGGRPVYGDISFEALFRELDVAVNRVDIQGEDKIACQDIKGLVGEIRKAVGFHKELEFLPVK